MKAMLLAAGRGERMGELTRATPKPLLQVAGKPLLQHHIERLVAAGFTELVINTSYLGEQIREFVGDGSRWQVSIQCTVEAERLETGGGIYNALPALGDRPFLLCNADVWTDFPVAKLRQRLQPHDLAHLILVANPAHNLPGDFALEQNQRVQIQGDNMLTYSGLAVLNPKLFSDSQPGRFPLAPLLRTAMAKQQVSGEFFRGVWMDVGTPQRLRQLESVISLNNQSLAGNKLER